MQQVLFHIPIHIEGWLPDGIPIYGYGMMLFLAFIACTWVASRRAEKEGIPRERIQDLAIWLFVFGIAGARILYMKTFGVDWKLFLRLWDGGLIFYGGLIGGVVGYFFAYFFVIRKHHLSGWKIADIVAPCVALGLGLGRLGCFLNGCCYGNVACPECTFQAHFPLSAPPRFDLVEKGYQTVAGFTLADAAPDLRTVEAVDPASPAAKAGLAAGDIIVAINGNATESVIDVERILGRDWPRGENSLTLSVKRGDKNLDVGPFAPRTIGLHPTQVYSSIGGFLIFCLLSAYAPLKRHDGELLVLLLWTYPLVRFLEESLRNDTPLYTVAWLPTMTLSQYISIAIFAAGCLLAIFVWTRPPIQTAPVA